MENFWQINWLLWPVFRACGLWGWFWPVHSEGASGQRLLLRYLWAVQAEASGGCEESCWEQTLPQLLLLSLPRLRGCAGHKESSWETQTENTLRYPTPIAPGLFHVLCLDMPGFYHEYCVSRRDHMSWGFLSISSGQHGWYIRLWTLQCAEATENSDKYSAAHWEQAFPWHVLLFLPRV